MSSLRPRHTSVMTFQTQATRLFASSLVGANNKAKQRAHYWLFVRESAADNSVRLQRPAMKKGFQCHEVIMFLLTTKGPSQYKHIVLSVKGSPCWRSDGPKTNMTIPIPEKDGLYIETGRGTLTQHVKSSRAWWIALWLHVYNVHVRIRWPICNKMHIPVFI